jgi:Domain of unknown function (DUF1929)
MQECPSGLISSSFCRAIKRLRNQQNRISRPNPLTESEPLQHKPHLTCNTPGETVKFIRLSTISTVAICTVLLASVFVACERPKPPIIVDPPQPIKGLQAEAVSSKAVQLDWANSKQLTFQLERESDGAGIEAVGVIEGTSFTDSTLKPGETYTYRLMVRGASDASGTLVSKPVTVPITDADEGPTVQGTHPVTLIPHKAVTLLTGQKITFTAITTGDNSNNVRWESSGGTQTATHNRAVFSSDTEGTFTVTAISQDDSSQHAAAQVQVRAGGLKNISLNATPKQFTLGDTSTLELGFDGQGSYGTGVTFTVLPNSGEISSLGNNKYRFKPTVPGTYKITATSNLDGSKTTSLNLTANSIEPDAILSSLKLTASTNTIDLNQTSSLSLEFKGTGNFGRGITWTTTPTGTVTGTGPYSFASGTPGLITIKATSTFDPSKSSSVNVTVRAPFGGATSLGKWSDVIPMPAPSVHLAVLPSGKVIFWEYDEKTPTSYRSRTYVWDAVNNSGFTQINNVQTALFCSGHSLLADGRLFAVGGYTVTLPNGFLLGSRTSSFFDTNTQAWSPGPNLNLARFYPSSLVLGNGDVLALGGTNDTNGDAVLTPEVWQANSSVSATDPLRFRHLTNAGFDQEYYPMAYQGANGKVFNLGPQKKMGWLDTNGTGEWQPILDRIDPAIGSRTYGNGVMYDNGKVVLIGGADPPTETALKIDITGPTPITTQVGSMAFKRRQHNATVLPDGTVLVTGGTSGAGFNDPTQPVFAAELWNPATGLFKTLSSAKVPRVYHSIAALLPDGRVLSSGGSGSGSNGLAGVYPNGEIFSPPYLFNNDGTPAARTSITNAPSSIGYGSSFSVTTDSEDVGRFSLIRLSSVTHSTNFDQRFINMPFNRNGTQSTMTAPANGNLAPPGYYLLFALNSKGVPSVGKILKLN